MNHHAPIEKPRVLVVDDECGTREALRLVLEPDCAVETSATADAALQVLGEIEVDVVTLEPALARDSEGEALVAMLRGARPDLELVILTRRPGVASAVEAVRNGAVDYLAKPFDAVEVRTAVARAVARRARARGSDPEAFLACLVETVEAQHPFLAGHSRRTALYAELLAERVGLSLEEQEHVRIAGRLHDIGKIGVPTELLLRPGGLRGAEREQMERHPEIGTRLVAPLELAPGIRAAIRHHHERWDGGGYPAGLSSGAIPLTARIIALADAWDAMTGERPYRPALSPAEALAEITSCAGRQFDPRLAGEFVSLLASARPAPSRLARAAAAAAF